MLNKPAYYEIGKGEDYTYWPIWRDVGANYKTCTNCGDTDCSKHNIRSLACKDWTEVKNAPVKDCSTCRYEPETYNIVCRVCNGDFSGWTIPNKTTGSKNKKGLSA